MTRSKVGMATSPQRKIGPQKVGPVSWEVLWVGSADFQMSRSPAVNSPNNCSLLAQ
jgi:hypothetical protein